MFDPSIKKQRHTANDNIILGGPAITILRQEAEQRHIPLDELIQQYLTIGRDVMALKNEHPDGTLIFWSEEVRSKIDIP